MFWSEDCLTSRSKLILLLEVYVYLKLVKVFKI